MNRPVAMFGAYKSIIQCESMISGGTDVWRSIAALMLPCYRNQLWELAQELTADEQREFEHLVRSVHSVDGG